MADASEDSLLAPPAQPAAEQPDLSDELQDFRFLLTTAQSQKLPSRGIKDFEPHGTNLQQEILEASREAMHLALSQTRVHAPDVARAVYDEVGNGAWVVNPQGSWAKGVGKELVVPGRFVERVVVNKEGVEERRMDKLRRLWLLPEEALWLLERGSLDIRYPAEEDKEECEGLPMSLQGAYAAFVGREPEGGLALEEYTVFQYLKRCGYMVIRAKDNFHNVPATSSSHSPPQSLSSSSLFQLWRWILGGSVSNLDERARYGPLVRPGLYRSYDDIYRNLLLVPFHDPKSTPQLSPPSDSSTLNITYHIYKAVGSFKKASPGPPDFYISVLSARHSCVPTESELDALLTQTPYHAPSPAANLYRKVKDGYRNVILAVVDQGVTSFVNFSDAGFGNEMLWGRPKKKGGGGGKRGGFGKRGRGRGR